MDPTFSLQIGKGRDVIRFVVCIRIVEIERSGNEHQNQWVIWTTHVGLVYDIR